MVGPAQVGPEWGPSWSRVCPFGVEPKLRQSTSKSGPKRPTLGPNRRAEAAAPAAILFNFGKASPLITTWCGQCSLFVAKWYEHKIYKCKGNEHKIYICKGKCKGERTTVTTEGKEGKKPRGERDRERERGRERERQKERKKEKRKKERKKERQKINK